MLQNESLINEFWLQLGGEQHSRLRGIDDIFMVRSLRTTMLVKYFGLCAASLMYQHPKSKI